MKITRNIAECLSFLLIVNGICWMAATVTHYSIDLPFILIVIGANTLIISLFIEEKMNENS